ncbi:hypothetical protein ACIBSV_42225 [Embleya sp. NPDC050154]|uniref:hypothetical protein n=1 Tax=Embleya sp. NPDC050154 TaxID=3363988 RepID=UPI0037A61564
MISQALAPADVAHVDDQGREERDEFPLREDGLPDPAAMTTAQRDRLRHDVTHDPDDPKLEAILTMAAFTREDPGYVRALYGHDLVDLAQRLATSTTMKLTGAGAR